MSSEESGTAALARAARRAEGTQSGLIAGLLPQWRRAFPGDDPAIAIAASPEAMARISLCRRPRAACWIDDAIAIARAGGADQDLVIRFLRTAEALEMLAKDKAAELPGVSLMAARDHEEDPT